jgi:hypothetical protein
MALGLPMLIIFLQLLICGLRESLHNIQHRITR